jgi:hypothetical protein
MLVTSDPPQISFIYWPKNSPCDFPLPWQKCHSLFCNNSSLTCTVTTVIITESYIVSSVLREMLLADPVAAPFEAWTLKASSLDRAFEYHFRHGYLSGLSMLCCPV